MRNDNNLEPTEYYKKYQELRHKQRINNNNILHPKKIKSMTQIIPNKNYDYSADTDEFCTEPDISHDQTNIINKISSINIKHNNINQLDQTSMKKLGHHRDVNSIHSLNSYNSDMMNNNNVCTTEPEEGYFQSNQLSNSFHNNYQINSARQQRVYNRGSGTFQPIHSQYEGNYYCGCGVINCRGNHSGLINFNINPMMRSSMISHSTHYSSNRKNDIIQFPGIGGEVEKETNIDCVEVSSTTNDEYFLINSFTI
jgi:hypothetical protein